jgi:hypothetical protein
MDDITVPVDVACNGCRKPVVRDVKRVQKGWMGPDQVIVCNKKRCVEQATAVHGALRGFGVGAVRLVACTVQPDKAKPRKEPRQQYMQQAFLALTAVRPAARVDQRISRQAPPLPDHGGALTPEDVVSVHAVVAWFTTVDGLAAQTNGAALVARASLGMHGRFTVLGGKYAPVAREAGGLDVQIVKTAINLHLMLTREPYIGTLLQDGRLTSLTFTALRPMLRHKRFPEMWEGIRPYVGEILQRCVRDGTGSGDQGVLFAQTHPLSGEQDDEEKDAT